MDLLTPSCSGHKEIVRTFAIFFVSLLAVYSVVFIIPSATEALMLEPAKLFSGEFWRLFTYQFVHNGLSHLAENIIALLLSVIIALELRAVFSDYSATYFSAGIFAILPVWLLSPFLALGASSAIYGSFGFLIRAAKRFDIKPYLLLAGVIVLTFASAIHTYLASEEPNLLISAQQFASHLAGLFFGYYFCLLTVKIREKNLTKRMSCLRSMT